MECGILPAWGSVVSGTAPVRDHSGSNPASAVWPPVAHAEVDTDKVPIRDADNRASRLTVVPRGPYLLYVCAVILDIASTIRSMSTTLLRVSGVSAHT